MFSSMLASSAIVIQINSSRFRRGGCAQPIARIRVCFTSLNVWIDTVSLIVSLEISLKACIQQQWSQKRE
jgi:hypothetical protein